MKSSAITKKTKKKIVHKYYRWLEKKARLLQGTKWLLHQYKLKKYLDVCFRGTVQEFYDKVSQYDVISFDIFDTLVTRCVQKPIDIFSLLGLWVEKYYHINKNEFLVARIKVESDENKRLNGNATLDDIYHSLQSYFNISKEKCEKIKNKEVELELKYIIPRTDVVNVLSKLKKEGKTIYLISDMYLPRNVIDNILSQCGIKTDLYDKIYLSSETKKRKDDSTIWIEIAKDNQKRKYIHIGDSFTSDYKNPRDNGLSSILIANSWERYESSLIRYCKGIDRYDKIGDKVIKGLIFNKCLYNSPFVHKHSELDCYAYVFFGPLFLQFCNWLSESTKKDNINHVWFLAREGFYLEPLYNSFCKKKYLKKIITTNYILTSRKAAAIADMHSVDAIKEYLLNGGFVGTLDDLLDSRFGIVEVSGSDKVYSLPRDLDKVMIALEPYKNKIYSNSKLQKKLYQEYIISVDPNFKNEKIGVVDIGYSGTAQYYLSNILDKKFIGYYFALSDNVRPEKNKQKCRACFFKSRNYQPDQNPWMLIESVLTAPKGQFGGFFEDGSLIFADSDKTASNKENLERFFAGIKKFIEDIFSLMSAETIVESNFSNGLALDLLKSFYWENVDIPQEVRHVFKVETTFNGGDGICKVFK